MCFISTRFYPIKILSCHQLLAVGNMYVALYVNRIEPLDRGNLLEMDPVADRTIGHTVNVQVNKLYQPCYN